MGLPSKGKSARSWGANGTGKAGQEEASRADPGMIARTCQQARSPDMSVG